MFWKTKKFKALQSKWYAKLMKSGFVDIEMNPTHQHTETARFADQEAVSQYYDLAQNHLNNTRFVNHKERDVWKYHTLGDSFRQIADKMSMSKNAVAKIVTKHVTLMSPKVDK